MRMTAIHYLGSRRLELADTAPAAPGPGKVVIDVAYTGICGTDLHVLHGAMDHRVTFPAIIGHEMSGRIAKVGPGVEGWAEGDKVTAVPLGPCGGCPACVAGNGHVCHRLVFIGIDAAGSLQSQWLVSAETLVRLPADMRLDIAALVEPVAVAVHDIERVRVAPGDQVLVVGGGPVGIIIALVAGVAGADVLVSEPSAERRAVAESLGVRTVDPTRDDLAATVESWTRSKGADICFEVSGSPAGIDAAVANLKVRGRLCLVAIHAQRREVDLFRFFWRELELYGARLYVRSDFDRAVELIHSGRIDVEPLITRIAPMSEVREAFEALERGDAMKILIDCTS
jgi:(R,R)-butanediol dehydrogenase / meso-butanediol dehydrogenase / diacetyl reductase